MYCLTVFGEIMARKICLFKTQESCWDLQAGKGGMQGSGPETLFWNQSLIYSYYVCDYLKYWKACLWLTSCFLEAIGKQIYPPWQVSGLSWAQLSITAEDGC